MTRKIALFNHKGGVSKTTTAFNLGWMLAEKGNKVIIVDADPQCNMTGLILGYTKYAELENFYTENPNANIRDALAPAFESMPMLIKAAQCIEVERRPGLFLLPGNIRLSEYEVTLGIAQELSGALQTLRNLPGSISYLLNKTAESLNADYIIIDMSPSLGAINQNLLMISDYFIVPSSPDYFGVMAIDSLTTIINKWHAWAKKAQAMETLQEATYPFPQGTPKFLGTVIQKYRLKKGDAASKGFQHWIDQINKIVTTKFILQLQSLNMALTDEQYSHYFSNYCIATISDFNTLIAKSQETQTPVFALTDEQIGHTGTVLKRTGQSRDNFLEIFEELTDKITGLINDADGN